ncbi:MAG: FkbM family methyltransferase [Burkholderiales bacterium]
MTVARDPDRPGNLTALRDCRHGRMVYLRNDRIIGRSLELYGEWSEGEVDVFRQIVVPGDVVVEAGANIGAHTVCLARLVGPSGAVVAYEAQRFVHQLLCANLAINEILNVHARLAAAGAAAGTINVPALDYASPNNVGGLSLGGQGGELVPVETIDALRLPRLKLLKIDVEGMESDVLTGAADTLNRLRPVLYVENDRGAKSEPLIRLIQGFKYRLWWHLPPYYHPANFSGNAENAFGGLVSINMLCMPWEYTGTVTGLREVSGPEDRP